MDTNVLIRTAVYGDIPQILELCKSVDRILDFDEIWTYMQLDPDAIIVAEHPEDDGTIKVIATCSGMRLGSNLGFMGLYMVHKNYRNQGIGKRLWDRALKRLENLNVGVRGDYRNFQNYKECCGFQHVADYVIAYYECFNDDKIRNIVKPKLRLSVATLFEGELVSVQNDNGKISSDSIEVIGSDSDRNKSSSISKNLIENNDTDIPFYKNSGIENKSTFPIKSDGESLLNTGLINISTFKTNTGYEDNTSAWNCMKPAVGKEDSFETNDKILDPKVTLSVKNSLIDTASTIHDTGISLDPKTVNTLEITSKKTFEMTHDLLKSHEIPVDKHETVSSCNSDNTNILKSYSHLSDTNINLVNTSAKTSNTISEITNEGHAGVCVDNYKVSLNDHDAKASKTTLSSVDMIIKGVQDYDRRLHGRDRSFIVKQTLSWESCRCKVAIGSKSVVGYGCLRPSANSVWIVSPLYADSEDIAEILLRELLLDFDFSQAPRGVQIRFPFQKDRCEFYKKMGLSDTGIRISTGYTKECIYMETSKIFSFHSTVFCSE